MNQMLNVAEKKLINGGKGNMKKFLLFLGIVILSLIITVCSLPVAGGGKRSGTINNNSYVPNNNNSEALASSAASLLENVNESTYASGLVNKPPVTYALNHYASGVLEVVNNISNLTVVSRDRNTLKAEYQAGFIQGHLQGRHDKLSKG